LGAPFAFWEPDFQKTKDRETLSRSHNNLNKSNDSKGQTASPHQPRCGMCMWELKIFAFEISYNFFFILTALGQNHW
jgi:hypothetical protein